MVSAKSHRASWMESTNRCQKSKFRNFLERPRNEIWEYEIYTLDKTRTGI